jgi:hypothetical protein
MLNKLYSTVYKKQMFRIRIGPGFNQVSGSVSRRAKMTQKVEKNSEISCFDVLDVLF